MKVAVVQFDPKIGQVQANIETARKLCNSIIPKSVELICLPEMCFTGYVFSGSTHIAPYLEDPVTGPTSLFCSQLAQRVGCYVAAGYAERLATHESIKTVVNLKEDNDGEKALVMSVEKEVHQVGANSAVVFDPHGQRLADYRKTNLFRTDMTWAKPGTGFKTLRLPPPLNTVTLGICMDLNVQPPASWTIDGPYEIAEHCVKTDTDILILLNAWIFSGDEDADADAGDYPRDWGTLNYWASRLRPLWSKGGLDDGKETKVIFCNRCGEENGKIFAGTSAMFSMRRGSDQPVLMHALGRRNEEVGIWDIR
ncbi:Carbon-nitrogen hydrolase [Steccherinum ochraceum]|uniref:Carbon-nitrogen hydrolase n=1 Tax=Steccherinum ochraceum TaxID=92696 RepID=A0A4R0RMZ7_9APHY|nr:Carbon-nitrogen hydrolase [Steccherinum ochraceum]